MNVITDDLIITQNMKRAAYKAIGSLVFVLAILLIWDKIFVTIEAGEAGVFFDRFKGTKVDKVYKEGFYVIRTTTNKFFNLNKPQVFILKQIKLIQI